VRDPTEYGDISLQDARQNIEIIHGDTPDRIRRQLSERRPTKYRDHSRWHARQNIHNDHCLTPELILRVFTAIVQQNIENNQKSSTSIVLDCVPRFSRTPEDGTQVPKLLGADTYYELIMICILLVNILSV